MVYVHQRLDVCVGASLNLCVLAMSCGDVCVCVCVCVLCVRCVRVLTDGQKVLRDRVFLCFM